MSEKEANPNEELQEEKNENKNPETTDKTNIEEDPVIKLEEEVKDLKDQNLRLYAEFETSVVEQLKKD